MKKWTDKDKVFLIKNLNTMSNMELAESLSTTEGAIKTILYRLGLRRAKKLKIDKKPQQEPVMCKPIKIQTCAPTKVIFINGKRTEIWGKQSFIQKLEARQ